MFASLTRWLGNKRLIALKRSAEQRPYVVNAAVGACVAISGDAVAQNYVRKRSGKPHHWGRTAEVAFGVVLFMRYCLRYFGWWAITTAWHSGWSICNVPLPVHLPLAHSARTVDWAW